MVKQLNKLQLKALRDARDNQIISDKLREELNEFLPVESYMCRRKKYTNEIGMLFGKRIILKD